MKSVVFGVEMRSLINCFFTEKARRCRPFARHVILGGSFLHTHKVGGFAGGERLQTRVPPEARVRDASP